MPAESVEATSDACDALGERARVASPIFRDYGGLSRFSGRAATVRVDEDNGLVRAALEQPGEGRVLVVDGGGSLRCALLGGKMAALAFENGWRGVIIHGCIRDSAETRRIPIGLKALQTSPVRSAKRGAGASDLPLRFADVTVHPGDLVYADEDGVVVVGEAVG